MDRFYLPPADWTADSFRLSGDEAHHCLRVMRKAIGDPVELFDGEGRWARGVIEQTGSEVVGRVEESGSTAPVGPRLVLCVAIPKGKTMELIVQKAVELGVAAVQPLVTEHTVVRLAGVDGERKRDKWQRVALEACKQCGQNHLPEVRAPQSLGAWLAEPSSATARFLASLVPGARAFREVIGEITTLPAEVEMLIGPEGDFSMEETEAALAAGFLPVTLGAIVLRVETAALYCLSALRFSWPGC